jgi:hypothetical protein
MTVRRLAWPTRSTSRYCTGPGKTTAIAIKHERDSVDFVVDGQSVFKATKADERGMSGYWIAGVDARIKAHKQARAEQYTFARLQCDGWILQR